MDYYVYMYTDQFGQPFYIGKGTKDRYKPIHHVRNKQRYIANKIKNIGVNNVGVIFLNKNIIEEDAMSWERYWIKFFGKRYNNTGCLCNITDGGEGTPGLIHSVEAKQKIALAHLGDKHSLGFKHTIESRAKMSLFQKGRRKTLEHRQKIANSEKGKIISLETREKIRISVLESIRKKQHGLL